MAVDMAEVLLDHDLMPFVPQLCFVWNLLRPRPDEEIYKLFLEYDFYWLSRCHALLRLPGESFGADEEIKVARALGIPVFFDLTDLLAAFGKK